MYLREKKQIALHVACGDITDVVLDGNKLVINVYDGMLINLLEKGKREIENAIRWQGIELELEIAVKEMKGTIAEKDIKKLNDIFGQINIIQPRNFN